MVTFVLLTNHPQIIEQLIYFNIDFKEAVIQALNNHK